MCSDQPPFAIGLHESLHFFFPYDRCAISSHLASSGGRTAWNQWIYSRSNWLCVIYERFMSVLDPRGGPTGMERRWSVYCFGWTIIRSTRQWELSAELAGGDDANRSARMRADRGFYQE